MSKIESINVSDLSLIEGTQIRIARDTPTELVYEEAIIEAGNNDIFPPIIVYRDATGKLWIADGHHRLAATISAGLDHIQAEVREGTKLDALEAACIANKNNALQLSSSDRCHAMEMLLAASSNYTNVRLAELVGVSRETVRRWRDNSTCTNVQVEKRVGRDGKARKGKYNTKLKAATGSPESQPQANTPKDTIQPEVTQQMQTCAEVAEANSYKRFDALWREIAEQIKPFNDRLREYRGFYGDNEYIDNINELFGI